KILRQIGFINPRDFEPPEARRVLKKVNDDVVTHVFSELGGDRFAQYDLIGVPRILKLDKLALDEVLPEGDRIEASPNALEQYAQRIVIRFYHTDLVGKLLYMAYIRVVTGLPIQVDVEVHRLFLRGIVHRKPGDHDVTAEAEDFFLDRFLKALHDEKGNDRRGQSYGDTDNGNFVDRRRKALLIPPADSFGYEIREIQFLLTFGRRTTHAN